jgi:predicted ester cyclase
MSSMEDNKNLVRRLFQEFWNGKNLTLADEFIAASFLDHVPGRPAELPAGPEGFKLFGSAFHAAYPAAHYTIEDLLADGDKVMTRWTVHATHQGDLMGIAATGKRVTVTGITIDQIVDGQVIKSWTIFDALGMLQQLGVVPLPGEHGKM